MEWKLNKIPVTNALTRLWKIIPWLFSSIILIFSSFPLGMLLSFGRFARYLADDYSTASELRKYGFWKAQLFWYQTWTGSYSYTFLTSLLETIGVSVVPWLVICSLFAWIVLTLVFFKTLFQVNHISISAPWLGILTVMAVFGTIKSFQNYDQLLFWQTGIIAYLSNVLIFLLIMIYFLRRFYLSSERPVSNLEFAISFCGLLLSGGICETWVVMQAGLFTLGLFLLWIKWLPSREGLGKALFSGFLASWVSFFITFRSPGNVRHSPGVGTLSLETIWNSLIISFLDIPRFLFAWAENYTNLVLALFTSGFLIGLFALNKPARENVTKHVQTGILILSCSYLMLWSSFFPGYAALQVRPPDRALFAAMFIFIIACLIFPMFIGEFMHTFIGPWTYRLVTLGLCILLGFCVYKFQYRSALSLLEDSASLRLYAKLWDERDALIQQSKTQGNNQVTICSFKRVPMLNRLRSTIWISGDLTEDPGNWINVAAANYYGMKSITASKDSCHE